MAEAEVSISVTPASGGRGRKKVTQLPPPTTVVSPTPSTAPSTSTELAVVTTPPPASPVERQLVVKFVDYYTKYMLESILRQTVRENGTGIELYVVLLDISENLDLEDDTKHALRTSLFPVKLFTRFQPLAPRKGAKH